MYPYIYIDIILDIWNPGDSICSSKTYPILMALLGLPIHNHVY